MHVIATAGHVDHGKSSLVLALTGTDPDRFAEEKRRGLTIDLGFAHTEVPGGGSIDLIDVPGHVRFLKNMLAGVGAVQSCLFVVAATEGWKPQSEEHLRIVELLGVSSGVIALTKVDLVDDDQLQLATWDVQERVAGTFLAQAEIVPVAAPQGVGIPALRAALGRLVAASDPAADRDRPRVWIDRVFAPKGSGVVVTGTLTGGSLAVDEPVVVWPSGRVARVRGLQAHGESVRRLGPGRRVAVNLSGVERAELSRGDALVRPGQWEPSARVDAELWVLASLDHVVSRRGAHVAYVGSGEWPCRIRVLGPASLAPGETGLIRLHLPEALPLVPGDRFIVRESGRNETIGGGEVLDVAPRRPASRARPDRDRDRLIAEHGLIDAARFEMLTGDRRAPTLARWIVAPDHLETLREQVRQLVGAVGPIGLDVATLTEPQRLVAESLDDIEIRSGRARPAGSHDHLAEHPILAVLAAGGFTPPAPDGVDRAELRQLARRALIVERDGIWFHPAAIDAAAALCVALLAEHREGFTVAEFRDAVGATRKYVLPLLNELDGRGVTRRRGDLRIGGPRLPG